MGAESFLSSTTLPHPKAAPRRTYLRIKGMPALVGEFDTHSCSPIPPGHVLLLRSEALGTGIESMPPVARQMTFSELVSKDTFPGVGFPKGMVAPFFDKDAFVVVAQDDVHKYRFAWLTHTLDYSSLGDLAAALKGRGWTRAPYVGFGFLCMPPEDSDYVKKHFDFVYTEMPKLASELHIFGTSSLKRAWPLFELAFSKRPIIYTAADFPEGPLLQHERENGVTTESYGGFASADCTVRSDIDGIKRSIEEIHGSVEVFDDKVRSLLSWQSDSGPQMRLLRVDALLNCSVLTTVQKMQVSPKMSDVVKSILSSGDTLGSLTSHQVLADYWNSDAESSVDTLFRQGAFVDLSWSDFRKASYAVLTYGWATITWSDIISVLKEARMGVEYVWIDIFCLGQNATDKMDVIERSPAIYGGAKEYHVFGKVVASRGWCTCELASARNPVLHTTGALPSNGLAHKLEVHPSTKTEFQGFELAEFFDDSDRAKVRKMIETQNFSVANFDAEMRHFFSIFGK